MQGEARHRFLLTHIKTVSLHKTSDKRLKMFIIKPISQVAGPSQGVRNVSEPGGGQFQGSFPHPTREGLSCKNKTKDTGFQTSYTTQLLFKLIL